MRGKLQKLPVAMPAVTGSSWQKAEFGNSRVVDAALDVPGQLISALDVALIVVKNVTEDSDVMKPVEAEPFNSNAWQF